MRKHQATSAILSRAAQSGDRFEKEAAWSSESKGWRFDGLEPGAWLEDAKPDELEKAKRWVAE